LEINDRDQARELIEKAGITSYNVTSSQLQDLWRCLSVSLQESGNYNDTYEMNEPGSMEFMTCKTDQWDEREAVSFNRDGFIGFAGWADKKNIKPILQGVGDWLDGLSA